MIIKRAGLLENPGIQSSVKSGKPLQLSLPDLRRDPVEILLFEQQSSPWGTAAQATLLAAEPFPAKLDPLVCALPTISGRQGEGDVNGHLLSPIYLAELLCLFQHRTVGAIPPQFFMAFLSLILNACAATELVAEPANLVYPIAGFFHL